MLESDTQLQTLLQDFDKRVAEAERRRAELTRELSVLERERDVAQGKRDAIAVEFGKVTSALAVRVVLCVFVLGIDSIV